MKTAKRTPKKVAKAPAAAKQLNVNLAYVMDMSEDVISSVMALRALVAVQAAEIANLRAQLEELK